MGNVTLIGMPGSGKTTIGKALAQALDMEFLDTDREIERLHGGTLAQLIAVHGQDGFRRLEEEVNAGLRVERTVIAPGGSVIYGPEAMAHLRAISRVIYLRLSYENVAARLGDLTARGVTFAPAGRNRLGASLTVVPGKGIINSLFVQFFQSYAKQGLWEDRRR